MPLAAVVVVGVALRTLVWWPSHNLFGVLEYDDGVYYAAAGSITSDTPGGWTIEKSE